MHAHSHDHGLADDTTTVETPGSAFDRSRASGQQRAAHRRRLLGAMCVVALYSVVELSGGILTGSLALLADAMHLFSDVGALALSLFALWVVDRPRDTRHSFGRSRAEILAALANGVALLAMSGFIIYKAAFRFANPTPIAGLEVVAFAAGALLANCIAMLILSSGRRTNLNIRGAWLHVASDAAGSVGVIVAGLCMWAFGWAWADAAASLAIGLLVLVSAARLAREAIIILMEAVPQHLDSDEIKRALLQIAGVRDVHDLHVWTIGSGEVSLSGHIVADASEPAASRLKALQGMLERRFDIRHTTLQLEAWGAGGGGALEDCPHACDRSL